MLLFVLPASNNKYSGTIIILNLFGIDETLLWVTWFVYLFIFTMLVFPLIVKILKFNSYVNIVMITLFSYSVQFIIYRCIRNWTTNLYWKAIFVCFSWLPIIIIGYLCAKENVYEKLIPLPITINRKLITILVVILFFIILLLKQYVPGYKIIKFDMIYAPVMIYCILTLFTVNNFRYLAIILKQLGDKSVYMWFIHALFFTSATRPIYHKFIMISDNL